MQKKLLLVFYCWSNLENLMKHIGNSPDLSMYKPNIIKMYPKGSSEKKMLVPVCANITRKEQEDANDDPRGKLKSHH